MNKLVPILLSSILLCSLINFFVNKKQMNFVSEFQKEQMKRDSIILIKLQKIDSLKEVRNILFIKRDSTRKNIATIINDLDSLSKPIELNDKLVQEALLWVELQNN